MVYKILENGKPQDKNHGQDLGDDNDLVFQMQEYLSFSIAIVGQHVQMQITHKEAAMAKQTNFLPDAGFAFSLSKRFALSVWFLVINS